jgi:hypothetical protein
VTELRRPAPSKVAATDPATASRRPERRRFLAILLGLGAAGVVAADPGTAAPVEDVFDGGRP